MSSRPPSPASIEVLPADEHNRLLLQNVRPADWTNPDPPPRYNLLVIGAGAAGLISASIAAGLGGKVALIERHLLGGDCLNVGCVPSKALIRAARVGALARRAGEYGVQGAADATVDFAAAMQRMRRLRASISPNDSAGRFRAAGVDVYFGQASFLDRKSVQVEGKTLCFSKAVIASGARAAAPPVPGLEEVGYLTNESVFSLTELPQRLAIIGAGPIGCELAQAFARFGSQVYLFEAQHGIMPNEDRAAAEIVLQALQRDGVQLFCCGKNLNVAAGPDGKRLTVDSHDVHYDISVDEILVGAGRTVNVESLALEAAGVEYDRHGVTVNDRLQTSNRNIFAAGDVCSRYKFTHAADAMARIVVRNALFFGRGRVSALTIPWCTYTEPEVAHVGLYEEEAHERGFGTQTFAQNFHDVDRAILDGETEGFVKVLVKKGSDRILGATIVGSHAGEMISEITLAMTARLGLKRISDTVHPYPTQAEALRKVADAYQRTRLTPWLQSLLRKWLAWRR
jgi:pyruvate/2-oxoglutarate dehydrogenase complex dihydrolipoamide dehydrogenase (E3) component